MNKTVEKSVGFAVAALLLTAPVALADHSRGGYGHKGGDFESKFFLKAHLILENEGELGLTDTQKEEIRALKHNVKKSMVKQNAEIEILGLDISEQMHGTAIDLAAVNILVDQQYELEKAKAKSLILAITKLKQTLTEEQYGKLKGLYKQGDKRCPFNHAR